MRFNLFDKLETKTLKFISWLGYLSQTRLDEKQSYDRVIEKNTQIAMRIYRQDKKQRAKKRGQNNDSQY